MTETRNNTTMRPTSGAQALETSGGSVIAGFVGAMHEAKRARDMRKYPFWARQC